jgi:hypothetical protein
MKTYAAVPTNTSWILASVTADIMTANARTKANTIHAITTRLIETRNSKNTGMRRIATENDTTGTLASMERLVEE